MKSHTYYDILGVSRDATLEEITSAKNALAKVYHPDANLHKDIDTTAFMQEILEAYQVLSNPEKRKAYNHEVFGEPQRVFRTFTVGPEKGKETKSSSSSFVAYWNAATRLNETLQESLKLMEMDAKEKSISRKFLRRISKGSQEELSCSRQIADLSVQAVQYITVLKMAGIPMQYWNPDAMNWVLIRWGQKQDMDYLALFSRYAAYVERTKTNSEKMKIRSRNRQFHNNLKKLLSYALES